MKRKPLFLSIFVPLVLAINTHAESVLNCNANPLSLGCIANRLTGGTVTIINMLLGLAFVSGWGFVIAAIFKFKQVRENPQQVPVSTPFAFLLTAVLLIFLPGLIETGSVTMFGSDPGKVGLLGQQAEDTGLITSTSNIDVNVISPGDAAEQNTLFGMAARVTELFPTLMLVITGGAYLAGLGFAIAAMVKLKAVKDNPAQNPVTMPLAYLCVAILLVFMPDLLAPTGETLFGTGTDQYDAGAEGYGSKILINWNDNS